MQKREVVVIGSGVAGMTASIYLKRAGIDVLVIECDAPGGQLNKSSSIENYPGFKFIDGPTLAMNIYEQVNDLNVDYLFDKVVEIKNSNDKRIVKTAKEKIECDYVILATGRTSRMLNLENEKKYIGKGISFCALCDGNFYKDKNVIVIGGGNSAIEEALYLANICKKVTIVHRRDKLTAEEALIEGINKYDNIEILYKTNVLKYNGDDNKIESVTLDNGNTIDVDGVFIAIRYVLFNNLIDVKKENGYILVDDNYETSISNIYACGDAIKKNTYQIATAIGEATNAASNIIRKIKGT